MESANDVSDVDGDSEKSVTSSERSSSNRPNKFKGPKSTWRDFTKEERLLTTSMTKLRDQDLSLHLYNAHSMKRRHYDVKSAATLKPWAGKARWGNGAREDNESRLNFVPPKHWTAWPLSADVVPRTGEQIGPGDDADLWTLKRWEPQRPSRELEEILLAVTLRISKDRFERRQWETLEDGHDLEGKGEGNDNETDTGSEGVNRVEDAMLGQTLPEDISQDTQPGVSQDASQGLSKSQGFYKQMDQHTLGVDSSHEAGEGSDHNSVCMEDSEPYSDDSYGLDHPIVSADDERSRVLLRPTIRNTLSRLDELLMALHNARKSCLHYASDHTGSQTDLEGRNESSDDNSESDRSRPTPSAVPNENHPGKITKRSRPGRPPKIAIMPAHASLDTQETVRPTGKRETRGRKRKLHVPLEGESHQEMLIRIARQQKKKMPFSSAPTICNPSTPSKSARGDSRKRGTSSHAREKRSTRLGVRDWSDIVGTAALVGFPPDVIARTTQRCATLFGEGMSMLTLVENPTSGDEDGILNYVPEEIPDLGNIDDSMNQSESEDSHPKIGRRPPKKRSRSRKQNSDMDISESEESKSSGIDAGYYCPYPECFRHTDGFAKGHYLSNHLRDRHKLDKQGVREAKQDSQEEMVGGVHVDGFMKEIRRRAGWRAVDKERRRRKSGRSGRGKSEVDMMEISDESVSEWDNSDNDMDEALNSD